MKCGILPPLKMGPVRWRSMRVPPCGNQMVAAIARPCWLRRAVRNRHRHAIEQAARERNFDVRAGASAYVMKGKEPWTFRYDSVDLTRRRSTTRAPNLYSTQDGKLSFPLLNVARAASPRGHPT